MQEGSFGELVNGRTYKVRLRPLEELISNGLLTKDEKDWPWYSRCQDGCIGVMVFDGEGFQVVDWGAELGFLWGYRLDYLKVLGEV